MSGWLLERVLPAAAGIPAEKEKAWKPQGFPGLQSGYASGGSAVHFNGYRDGNCGTDHRVVAHAQETHHFHVSRH